jgi:spermidine synthase
LTAGYATGGVCADRFDPRRVLGLSLTAAGALVSLSPFVLPRLARALVPDDLGLDQAAWILRAGAFVTEAALFGIPVYFAAFANPLLVRMLCNGGLTPGRAAGAVLWTSTAGGLTGTFATTYALVPNAGVRATLLGTGIVLAFLGMASLWGDRRRAPVLTAAIALAAPAATLGYLAQGGLVKPAGAATVLAEVQSREQYARVIEVAGSDPNGARTVERWLQVNEGLDSFQSLDAPQRATPGHYYDMLAFAALLSGEALTPSVLLVGSGAGSTARSLLEIAPRARIEGFELDPAVVDLGRKFLRLTDLEARGFEVRSGIDGRVGLTASAGPYDAILIDAYARQVEIPFHLVTREMFDECLRKLSPRGVVAVNVSSFGDEDPILEAVASTLSAAVGRPQDGSSAVKILRVRRDHNAIVLARKDRALPDRVKMLDAIRSRSELPPILRALAQYALSPEVLVDFQPARATRPLTDDWAPVEAIQAASLAWASARWN